MSQKREAEGGDENENGEILYWEYSSHCLGRVVRKSISVRPRKNGKERGSSGVCRDS